MNPHVVRRAAVLLCAAWIVGLGSEAGRSIRASERLETDSATQVLILHSGRTLKGKISRSPNGYVVEHSAGRLVVPFDETRVVGNSLPDAYRRLRETFVNLTAATHYELASWCWTNQLRDEARAELVMALDRDAEHEAARDLLERIDEQLAASRKKPDALKLPAPRIVNGIELPEVESLAGLSRETAAQFSTRVQPLLMNKCANSSCHGSKSGTEFHLNPIRGTGPGHRMYSERNLAMVMAQLDLAHPDRSPLLAATRGNHGGMNRAICYGPSGEKQRQLLADWVKTVAKEKKLAQKHAESPSNSAEKKSAIAKSKPVDRPGAEISEPTDDNVRLAAYKKKSIVPEDEPATNDDDAVDAFDPDVFNRKHHSRQEKKTSRQSKSSRNDALQEPLP